ncbi:MAG: GNAT family N-acetyltransferase [Pseudomonadota bacterium]|nr:GNAT family N-acetyltransferase [Pseudomonadota bacterium]
MIVYRDAVPEDGPALAAMARRCFTETFGTLYRQADLAAFLHSAYGENGLIGVLRDSAHRVRLAVADAAIVGYCTMGPVAFPGEWPDDAVELCNLYVLGPWQGEGIAPVLIEWGLDWARRRAASEVILSVFVDNHRARRFYERYGFVEFAKYTFMVGEHRDDDRLMRLTL